MGFEPGMCNAEGERLNDWATAAIRFGCNNLEVYLTRDFTWDFRTPRFSYIGGPTDFRTPRFPDIGSPTFGLLDTSKKKGVCLCICLLFRCFSASLVVQVFAEISRNLWCNIICKLSLCPWDGISFSSSVLPILLRFNFWVFVLHSVTSH